MNPEAHRRMIVDNVEFAIRHSILADQCEMLSTLESMQVRLQAHIDRVKSAPKRGLLDFVGKSPEEIEEIKRASTPCETPDGPESAA